MSIRVIDSHVHFPAIDFMGDGKSMGGIDVSDNKWVAKDRAKWRLAWRFPEPISLKNKNDENNLIEIWYEEVLNNDIEKIVFVTAGGNDMAFDILNKHPDKFVMYAHHDPDKINSADELEVCIRDRGFKGYKLLGPRIDTPLNDKSLYPVWEVAQSYKIPVLIHFGILGGAGGIANHVNINPLILHDVARSFPDISFIIPHFGCGYVFETLQLGWACPNVSIDTSGSNQWMRWMPYDLDLIKLFQKYYNTFGYERIIFGTDSSWFPRGFTNAYLDEQIRAMVYSGFSEDEIDSVLYKNIFNLIS
ncbi:amidohydrolase family protein [Oceanotoga sp. DSM 15011]|uniref:amidohydrolase family protein n=1 Tax=Oceanotoga sp. DSM 15011 TaxID=2984951 RepID=UPI0021F45E97|nr:amidohydrolase family protein [Oceanotoga sp. DSM 15011]UYO99149.1 amidohydrolase family protein [Oceanotoga sp. DSM 15011]